MFKSEDVVVVVVIGAKVFFRAHSRSSSAFVLSLGTLPGDDDAGGVRDRGGTAVALLSAFCC